MKDDFVDSPQWEFFSDYASVRVPYAHGFGYDFHKQVPFVARNPGLGLGWQEEEKAYRVAVSHLEVVEELVSRYFGNDFRVQKIRDIYDG